MNHRTNSVVGSSSLRQLPGRRQFLPEATARQTAVPAGSAGLAVGGRLANGSFFPSTLLLYAFRLPEHLVTSQSVSRVPGPRPLSPTVNYRFFPHGLRWNSLSGSRRSLRLNTCIHEVSTLFSLRRGTMICRLALLTDNSVIIVVVISYNMRI